ncbi:DUF3429 domain-containing protein [Paragemmobacter straminiformis]|uniref:DUF3429 domain-containing protein n=1 Tax=Paragemmobacter straminiformis TaxID=2045119 RepID=A0A842IBX0_9RHOB|nr:DUF3429 domain-containing protein [Gemmobacter straminiformis]MBC2837522.1 DUF3429 domain-containing protein [Gemmobacter straminiformis]
MIPRSALLLGLAGLIPFVWGAATTLSPALASGAMRLVPPVFVGAVVLVTYGTVILSFMSGVLWGFATKAEGREATVGYVLSVIPALWAFFMVTDTTAESILWLATGFAALLALDFSFARQGLAPAWWMRLRVLLTLIVLACLLVVLL